MAPSSLRAQIYTDLRKRLQRAEFGPGFRLVDTEIAAEYRTSRMPAREALMALMSQGFLSQTSRGFMVPELTADDVREIFAVRKLLEPEAAGVAALKLDQAGLAALRVARDMARSAGEADDAEGLMEANIAFRGTWLAAVDNRRLVEIIESFRDHIQTVRISTLLRPDARKVVLDGIEALAAAFVEHHADAVRARMRAFMDAAEKEYFDAVNPVSDDVGQGW
ncbi:GntR family transcriptional regulator [Microbaculum marinum]|uniref:GntR family transcriptional regulator n=1 Tax=Microbaculum marinum TaxID=1764581 RepID=A0AAW9RTR2_9HYPH